MARQRISAETVNAIQACAASGMSRVKIADTLGIGESTVDRYVQQMGVKKQELAEFKRDKGDMLELVQKASLEMVLKVAESITGDDLAKATISQKADLMRTGSIVSGTMFDKSRLFHGQSTANIQSLLVVAQKKVDELDVV